MRVPPSLRVAARAVLAVSLSLNMAFAAVTPQALVDADDMRAVT